ncbi:MAG: hypothetical protein HY707_03010 [Ignavibacteriae bacterium]|nr:hypothetical protein [Ignavibacteriota bacterium]
MSLREVLNQSIVPSSNGRRGAKKEEQKSESIFTDYQAITFEGKCFQFSGTLEFGKRDAAVLALEKLGGFTPGGNDVTRLVNYLVVGNLQKGARKRKGYRDKISKAINLNREAHGEIQIIRERDFVKAVLKTFRVFETKEKPFVKTRFAH